MRSRTAPPGFLGEERWLPLFGNDVAYWIIFFIFSVLTCLALWSITYLPMVDLPYHAAQVSILRHYHNPEFGFADQFRFHWISPYALPYYLAYLFSLFFSVLTAMKIVVTLSLIAFPLALKTLLQRTGGDSWWSLIGFATAFGFSFLWGFFSFLVALPIGVFSIARSLEYAYQPSRRNGLFVTLLLVGTFFMHGMVFGMCAVICAAVIASSQRRFWTAVKCMWPLFLSGSLALVWCLDPANRMPLWKTHIDWDFGIGRRLWEASGSLLSIPSDPLGRWMSVALLVAGSASVRFARRRGPFVLIFLIVLGIFLAAPTHAFKQSLIYRRFPIFLLIAGLMMFYPTRSQRRLWIGRIAIVTLTGIWLGLVNARFRGFDTEMRGFDFVMESASPNRRFLGLIFDQKSRFVPNHPFDHAAGWYQTVKGGVIDQSFSHMYHMVAQFKYDHPGKPIDWILMIKRSRTEWYWAKIKTFDYLLVRNRSGIPEKLKNHQDHGFRLASHRGDWWLLEHSRLKDPPAESKLPAQMD